MIYLRRDLILRELSFAQLVLGTLASAVVPVLSILLLLTAGNNPCWAGARSGMAGDDRGRCGGDAFYFRTV